MNCIYTYTTLVKICPYVQNYRKLIQSEMTLIHISTLIYSYSYAEYNTFCNSINGYANETKSE